MKKTINETQRTILAIDIIFYGVYIIIGLLLLAYPEIEVLEPIKYASALFYILGFFSLVAYFANRRPNNYEFLILGLINILVASVIAYYQYYGNTSFILGNAVLIYSMAMVLNKGWHTIKLSRDQDINMFPKFAITILLTLLGFLVITNLYNNITMQTLVLGYYFLSFGVLSLIEPIMVLIIKNVKIKKYLEDLIRDDKKIKKVSEVVIEKPVNKENEIIKEDIKLNDHNKPKKKSSNQSTKKPIKTNNNNKKTADTNKQPNKKNKNKTNQK